MVTSVTQTLQIPITLHKLYETYIIHFNISTLTFSQSKGTISEVLTDKDSNNETLPLQTYY
jgi:hypothetical protein